MLLYTRNQDRALYSREGGCTTHCILLLYMSSFVVDIEYFVVFISRDSKDSGMTRKQVKRTSLPFFSKFQLLPPLIVQLYDKRKIFNIKLNLKMKRCIITSPNCEKKLQTSNNVWLEFQRQTKENGSRLFL